MRRGGSQLPRHEYRLVDVFTDVPFAGNPLAVFPRAEGLEAALMQRIAAELNLSETSFVLPPTRSDCDFRVRIFTPRAEVPMAGHPSVGTAFVLDPGERVVFEEGVGPVPLERVRGADGRTRWRMTQPAPRFGPRLEERAAAAALGLEPEDLHPELPVEIVSTGMPFLLVALRDLGALGRARLRADAWASLARGVARAGVYLFVPLAADRVRSRMFAPDHGIPEDPATGAASGPLGAYLVEHGVAPPGRPARIDNEQGVEMGRPSRIAVEIEGGPGAISAVRVAGECVHVGGGRIDL